MFKDRAVDVVSRIIGVMLKAREVIVKVREVQRKTMMTVREDNATSWGREGRMTLEVKCLPKGREFLVTLTITVLRGVMLRVKGIRIMLRVREFGVTLKITVL